MTDKELIIEICRFKSDLIKKEVGFEDYMTEEDFEDIQSWEDEDCKYIIDRMKDTPIKAMFDINTCPWCLSKSFQYCNRCGYGERNGICGSEHSKYDRLIYLIIDSKELANTITIMQIPGMKEGIRKILKEEKENDRI